MSLPMGPKVAFGKIGLGLASPIGGNQFASFRVVDSFFIRITS